MDVEAQDRLRGRVLVGATVLALIVGGWWWRAAAPEDERALGLVASVPGLAARAPGATPPIAGLTAAAPTDMRLGPSNLGPGAVFEVDPATGAAVRAEPGSRQVFRVEPDGSVFRVDPETGETHPVDRGWLSDQVQPGRGRTDLPGSGEVSGGLSRYPNTLWREQSLIAPERSVIRQVNSAPDARYMFEYSCTGPGGLIVMIAGGRSVDELMPICDGRLRRHVLVGAGGPLRVSLAPLDAEAVRVRVQLAAIE
ncbi:hypothetical protein E1211_29455 [Micromonospora sp. 15K316]|uniref:hypothetical protein n=1 Tax=Micromonospora sp. 15K316 TaxID=2530376 RepID=UPI00104CE1CE|nr:hypothetical protein [Micromonospora sp. 15K316]TDC27194.1 hypothetical protein E1211_29455 [Micromonospora sp. 15K316]